MSNLLKHADKELRLLGYSPDSEEGPNKWTYENVMELMKVFSEQGHSGYSAGIVRQIFGLLADFKPLSPLTGDDEEWQHVGDDLYQNKRRNSVFKQNNYAYDIDGKIFREPDGCCYQSKDSHVPVTFPYTPKTEIVDVPFHNVITFPEKKNETPTRSPTK